MNHDYEIDDLVHLLPTPGHTPGHVAVCFGRDGADGVVSGDLIHSPIQAYRGRGCMSGLEAKFFRSAGGGK